jgi:hypothetical protein
VKHKIAPLPGISSTRCCRTKTSTATRSGTRRSRRAAARAGSGVYRQAGAPLLVPQHGRVAEARRRRWHEDRPVVRHHAGPAEIRALGRAEPMAEYLAQRSAGGGATPEDADARAARAPRSWRDSVARRGIDVVDAVHGGDRARAARAERMSSSCCVSPARRRHRRSSSTLTMPQALDVFRRSTPREQALFAEALLGKVQRKMKEAQ